MTRLLILGLIAVAGGPTWGQAQTADTLRPKTRLADLEVSVARTSDSLRTVPHAVSVIKAATLQVAQPGLGLDETLTTVPGVHVANRWNYSLDQRLSIRGFGSRANFGVRGVKVLLDGVPQTLPDGQSQLTNVEYMALERVEVLRGAASALHGNSAGGVLLLTSAPIRRTGAGIRSEVGSFGTTKWLVRGGGYHDRAWGGFTFSRFRTDGFRDHSAADLRQGTLSGTYLVSGNTTASARFAFADNPQAQNPGALTFEQATMDPRSAAVNNVARGADKDVAQRQLSLTVRHIDPAGWRLSAAVFGLWRDLANPLATPPPGPFQLNAGTYNTIDRVAGGGRIEGSARVGAWRGGPLVLTAGVDIQRMRDQRENVRSIDGEPTTDLLARQREVISEVGPFAQLRWDADPRWSLRAGMRLDRIVFDVTDQFLDDGDDHSGRRVMSEPSATLGLSYRAAADLTLYGTAATSFETPTSTELITTATGTVGLNDALGPQRALGVEAGARWDGPMVSGEIALFRQGIRRAIVQAREQDGRAFFSNAGRLNVTGLEAGLELAPTTSLRLRSAYTLTRARFDEYRLRDGEAVDTLDGNTLAGLPTHFLRLGVSLRALRYLDVELDQITSSGLYVDDRNTQRVPGWDAGVTNLRVQWAGRAGQASLTPFVALMNVFNRRYIGSVTINGFGGRVLEPSPGRYAYVGLDLDWSAR